MCDLNQLSFFALTESLSQWVVIFAHRSNLVMRHAESLEASRKRGGNWVWKGHKGSEGGGERRNEKRRLFTTKKKEIYVLNCWLTESCGPSFFLLLVFVFSPTGPTTSHTACPSPPLRKKGALTHTLAAREERGWGMLFLQSCTVVLTLLPSCGFILPKIESKKIYTYAELNQQIKGLSDVTGWWEVCMLWMNSKAPHISTTLNQFNSVYLYRANLLHIISVCSNSYCNLEIQLAPHCFYFTPDTT